jgi:hypothetical protein
MADYTDTINQAAQSWNIDPTLLRALIEQESGYNPQATSKAGAFGLTQLMPDTAKAMGVTDPADPVQQIYGGAKYLSQALDATKTPEQALLYYHGGPDWQKNFGPESAAYPGAVTKRYLALKQENAPAARPQPAPADPFTAALDAAQATPSAAVAAPADPFIQALQAAQKAAPAPEAQPAAAPSDQLTNEYGITNDPQQFNKPNPAATFNVDNVVHSAVEGAKEGFGSGPLGLSPQSQTALENAGVYNKPGEYNPLKAVNRAIINPLAAAGDAVLRGGSALMRGGQAAVAQTGAELGAPQLGRDIAALPEAFAGDAAAINPMRAPSEAPINPLTAAHQAILDRQAADLAARTPQLPPANPLAATVNAPDFVPPGSRIPSSAATVERPAFVPPQASAPQGPRVVPNALTETPVQSTANPLSTVPAPQSVGAAASRDMTSPSLIDMTPAQVQAYRSTAEGQKLLEPQQPGIADPNIYVPGVTPNQAEIEQSVNTARELKALNVSAPEVSQEAKEIAAENNDARQKFFSSLAGSDVDIANAKAARAAQAEKDLTAAWQNKTDADIQPVLDAAEAIKTSPDGKRPLVRSAVDSVTSELTNPDGTPVTDPELLYGVRKHIDDLMSKEAAAADAKNIRAASNLQDLKQTLDGVIEQAAPGFGHYLQNFSDASRPIDTMTALQGFENKLYDSQNRMGYNQVQRMMRQIVDSRAAPGLNPFKSIPDETMQQLWNLRDDLRRSASAQELARTPGSDTTQTMTDVLKGVGKSGANLAVHGALATHLGPYANVLYHGAKNALNAGAEARAANKRTARGLQILRPDPSQLRNPLQAE